MKNLIIFLSFFLFITFSLSAQEKLNLSGSFYADTKIISSNYNVTSLPGIMPQVQNKKSPILAGLFSLVLPGSGEIYAESYLKGAIFMLVEAAVITTAIIYDNKGDKKTEEFQNYADDYRNPEHNWSVVRYAEWVIQNQLGGVDPGIIISDDESLPPWERINWSILNANEHGSHKLPPHGDQQYYELIGKYFQYSVGWNDHNGGPAVESNASENFWFYSGMRGDANDLYKVASTAVIGIYVNHFLSALDAIWTTAQFNKNLAFNVRVEKLQIADKIELAPKINLSYSF